MDDRRFDSLAKALAGGASRRSVLKGILGLGGAAAVSGTLLEGPAEAARRPTPTPKPVTCPGNQTWNGTKCVCPAGLSQCVPNSGPACCNDTAVAPGTATYSECCDNACCHGHCYGEELCCPYPRTWCEATQECCPIDKPYCCGDGCCSTPCCDTTAGSVCCEGETPKCCPHDICIPASGCCTDEDCPGCQSCENHICVDDRANCPGGTAGCDNCVAAQCVADNSRCNDGNACNDDICNVATGQCSHPFNCHGQASCCDDGNPCTSNICNENGTCSNPFYCTSDACCDENPSGPACNLDTGACYNPCAGDFESCANVGCCSGWCLGVPEIIPPTCLPCIPNDIEGIPLPCFPFCDHCCSGQSYLGFCVSCGLQFASCQGAPDSCCDGFECCYSSVLDNYCSAIGCIEGPA